MFENTINKFNIKLFNNISASANAESDPLNIQSVSLFCVQFTWKSFSAVTPAISLLASNSLDEEFIVVDTITPTGSSGGDIINIQRAGYGFIKVKYTCASGSGTITASVNAKS